MNVSKKIDGSLFGCTGIFVQEPGLKTGAARTDTLDIVPGHGIPGGIGISIAPVQYIITAGPIISNNVNCFDI
jgi:hypothetical protein